MTCFTTEWNCFLDRISEEFQDLYYREEYIKLYETESEKACCFVFEDSGDVFLFPFLKRTFDYQGKECYDFETAYGYGGYIANNHSESFLEAAYTAFAELAKKENFICGFVRFHPVLNNIQGFDKIGQVYNDRKTIAIDLSAGIDNAWMNEIHKKNRNVIKKGEKEGIEFVLDYNFENLESFVKIYDSTMDKLSADSFYYFKHDYYEQLRDTLKNRFLGLVKYEEKIIAAAIFFFQKPYGHYHLAGSDKNYLNLSPNNFLLWNAAVELEKNGVKRFHLGGGTDGTKDNSLFLFKKKFSKQEYQFSIGKTIFNPELYNQICMDWERNNPQKVEQYKRILLKYKY